jgi:D-lyxose ketol-isomerase
MITIKILNAREIVEREKGRLMTRLAGKFIDLELKVEEELVKRLQAELEKQQIQAEIRIVPGDSDDITGTGL